MKKFLLFAITLLCTVQTWAANPSFQSFSTNDFIVIQPLIYAKHTNTGGTNIFNGTVIINTNTTIINTGDLIVNTNTTIVNNITTNITENSTIINTNVVINNISITNFFDNSVVIITNTSVTINGTNVPTVNPTIGRLPYKSGTNSFDDSALYFIDPSTVGAQEVDAATVGVTNLVAGGIVVSVDSGAGYGYLTNIAFADTLLWTNVGGSGGSYQPTQLQGSLVARGIESYGHLTSLGAFITQLSAFELLIVGENDVDVSGASYLAVVGPSSDPTEGWLRLNSGNGIGQHLFIVNSADNSAFHMLNGDPTWDNPGLYLALSGGNWVSTNKGDTIQLLGTFNGWAEVGRFWVNTNIVIADLWTNSAGLLQPVGLTNSLFWTNRVIWGPGTTNSLYRSGTDLVWTNGSSTTSIKVVGSGGTAKFGVSSDIATVTGVAGTDITWTNTTAKTVRYWNNYIHPLQSGIRLGGDVDVSPITPFSRLSLDGFYDHYGFISGSTNYDRLRVSHTGTNGDIVFDSQSAGTAGIARPIKFQSNGTNLYTFSTTVTDPILTVSTAAGTTAKVEAFGSSGYFRGDTLAYFVNKNVNGFQISDTSIQPVVDGTMNLGGITSGEGWFKNTGVSSTNFIRGFFSASTNLSVLALSHEGTNGNVSINSRGAGIAGPGRPIVFSIDSTNIFKIDGTSGASTTGVLIYENGTAQRVTVGAADSGGAGFRVLRIPN